MRRAAVMAAVVLVAASCGLTRSTAFARETDDLAKTFAGPGDNAVATVSYDWKDDARDREVPVKIYYPKSGPGPFPVIVFSHGLGGSREGYEFVGRQWAGHGYVSVHPQHRGSDNNVWKGKPNGMQALRESVANPMNAVNRPADVTFVINRLEKLNQEAGPLKGRLDLTRLGAAGHSFGAFTTLAVAGEVFALPVGPEITATDPRVKAAIPMSAPVVHGKQQLDKAYGSITIPCLHMTGTEDSSPIGETAKEDRRLPFDHSKAPNQYLIIFQGGDHVIFGGRMTRLPGRRKDARFHELIRGSSTAFWDAYLKGDAEAKRWLAEGGFEQMMGRDGTLEKRLDPAPAAAGQ